MLPIESAMAMHPEAIDILIFEVGGQRHGVLADQVQELLPALAITPLPGAPPGVEGIINLRGIVVPVLDMRLRLGLPAQPLGLGDHFIVLRGPDRPRALHVDRAVELVRIGGAEQVELDKGRVVKWRDALVPLHAAAELLAGWEGAS